MTSPQLTAPPNGLLGLRAKQGDGVGAIQTHEVQAVWLRTAEWTAHAHPGVQCGAVADTEVFDSDPEEPQGTALS